MVAKAHCKQQNLEAITFLPGSKIVIRVGSVITPRNPLWLQTKGAW
jgi:hypothetical protein